MNVYSDSLHTIDNLITGWYWQRLSNARATLYTELINLERTKSFLPLVLPVMSLLCLIGFNTSNVVRGTLHQLAHQLIGLSLGGNFQIWAVKIKIQGSQSVFVEQKGRPTLIFEPTVLGLPLLSGLMSSGNRLLMNELQGGANNPVTQQSVLCTACLTVHSTISTLQQAELSRMALHTRH